MKRYIKAFMDGYRPQSGQDYDFDLKSFEDDSFDCGIGKKEHGIYIISATDGTKYRYPNSLMSPIIYIGKSDDLYRRLHDEHYVKGLKRLLDNPDWGLEENYQLATRYQYMYYNGCHVDVYKCKGKQDAKNQESMFLNQFYQKYRGLPVGNAARSYAVVKPREK